MPDIMTVCKKLDAGQREAIVAKFCKANPHWRGAHVEDIIDALDDTDSDLGYVETAWEAYPTLRKPGFGAAVRALIWSGTGVSETNLQKLLD